MGRCVDFWKPHEEVKAVIRAKLQREFARGEVSAVEIAARVGSSEACVRNAVGDRSLNNVGLTTLFACLEALGFEIEVRVVRKKNAP